MDFPVGYYTNYNPDTKKWRGVGFNSTKFVQAAELNDLQRILLKNSEDSFSRIFNEGQFDSGGNISVALEDTAIQVTISSGTVYALGAWHDVPTTTIEITGVGKEVIGLKIDVESITSQDDADLLSPAIGAEGYNQASADRIQFTLEYVLNDNKSIPIATFENGQLIIPPNKSNGFLDQILAILAQRTAEKDGSFLAVRPQITLSDPTADAKNIHVNIRHGIGYINGVRRQNELARLSLQRPFEGKLQPSEAKTFTTGTNVYSLNKTPILSVEELTAYVQSPTFNMTRGAIVNGSDAITAAYTPTYQIQSITQTGNPNSPFVQNTDYQLGADTVTWLPGGNAPAGGSTYTVQVLYTKDLTKAVRTQTAVTDEAQTIAAGAITLAHTDLDQVTLLRKSDHSVTYVEGTHYTVSKYNGVITFTGVADGTALHVSYTYWAHTTEGDFVSRDSFVTTQGNQVLDNLPTKTPNNVTVDFKSQIHFDTTSSYHPYNNSAFTTDYKYVLPRRDVLVWREDGLFEIKVGTPALNPALPKISDRDLPIVKFSLPAEARMADVTLEYYDNLTLYVTDLRDMLRSINTINFNLSQLQLEQDLSNTPTPTDKIGIFADSLETWDLADRANGDFGGTFDFLDRSFWLPRTIQQKVPTLTSSTSTLKDGWWVPNFSEATITQQPFASTARVINKFGAINTRAKVTLSTNFNSTVLPEALTLTTVYTTGPGYVQDVANCRLLANVVNKTPLAASLGMDGLSTDEPWYVSKVKTATGWTDSIKNNQGDNPLSTVVVTSEKVSVRSNQWAEITRNTKVVIAGNTPAGGTISVSGSIFGPLERFISCSLDGKPVALTATGATVQETDLNYPGTVKAKSDGTFTANMVLPSNIKAGLNKFEFFGMDPNDFSRIQSYTTASYVATPNMEYVNLTVKVAPNFNGWSWSWVAPPWAMCDTLGLPEIGTEGYSTWWEIGQWSWTSVAHMIASGIAACVKQGISLTTNTLEDGISVLAAYCSLNTVLTGDMIHSIALAANLTSTDIEGNARAMIAESPLLGVMFWNYTQAYVVDPLAQTFQVFEDQMLSSVELFFNVVPSTSPVGVAITEVENGVPMSTFITEKWLQPADITGSSSASVATKFTFDKPVFLKAYKDYAFVVITEDPAASIWTAVLGQKDLSNNLITKNPAAGVCLESADQKSWQPIASTDIKFVLNSCKFTELESYVNTGLQTFSTPIGQFNFSVPFKELGPGTEVTHQYSLDNSNWLDCQPMVDTNIGSQQTEIYFRVKIKSTEKLCPAVINAPNVDGYLYQASGAYVAREQDLGSVSARYFDAYIDTYTPGGTAIHVYHKLDGAAYVELTEDTGAAVVLENLEDGQWVRRRYTYDAGVGNLKQLVRPKITLSSSNPHISPAIRKVRTIAR